ncbi:hypothetical protein AVEN_133148-1 [Araneus ventricosus]|uniref:Uncharacterized protein n=1 Tax=Araneus ventricosus TaxID=182803 RepID=A0A4Y2K9R8_ARAVE|nr:hypothetical protein AVEN_133148-1 [Araneus ventricosus]
MNIQHASNCPAHLATRQQQMPSSRIINPAGFPKALLRHSWIGCYRQYRTQWRSNDKELPHRWIGCAGLDDVPLLPWLPRSPDLMPCDFFLWYYAKGKVYASPMPTTLQKLQERITAALTDIDGNMLLNVWTEMDYRWDVCRVSKGTHVEHL